MLAPGSTLGPYEILAPIGAGGMGEVYRARDTRLDRDVAIKVLPAGLAGDAEGRARLEREARAVASLNHPNICTLHDVGEHAGMSYLVMEILEGRTVAEQLLNGPMSVGDVLRVGAEIADALDRAHRRGLVHRDLKPANIMLVGSGRPWRAKLLDFGLAKPREAAKPPEVDGRDTPTTLGPITAQGTVVGTFQYMSPEQIEAGDVDGRTDIWALGATLYEMATGQRAFDGTSAASLISAVLRDEPRPMAELRPLTPPALDRVVRQCLAKNPDERWQSAGDLKRELEWLSNEGAAVSAGVEPSAPRTRTSRVVSILTGGVGLVAVAAAFLFGRSSVAPPESWTVFTQLTDRAGEETAPSLSPDGTSFAYASRQGGTWDVYVQRVGGRTAIPVAADPNRDESWPAFSPDGQRIAFSESDEDGGIFVVGSTGESVNRLTDFGFNPTWSPDGSQIAFATEEVGSPYVRSGTSSLWVADVGGGQPRRIYEGDGVQPAWSPSGRRIAFWQNVGGQRDLATVDLAGGPAVVLLDDVPLDWSPTWAPDGRFLYFSSDRGGSMGLWRIPIDETTGAAAGEADLVAAGAEASMALPGLSSDGATILFRSEILSVNPVAIPLDPDANRAGTPRDLLRGTGIYSPTSVSPDGQWLALGNIGARQEDIFLMRTDGSELRRLTDDLARDRVPRFTPDGSALTFYSNRDGAKYGAWMIRTDGSGLTRLSDPSAPDLNYVVPSPDGDRLLVSTGTTLTGYVVRPPWPFRVTPETQLEGQALDRGILQATGWSPDGRMVFGPVVSAGSGPVGFAVYDLSSSSARQVSADAGLWGASWLPNSRRLVYVTQQGELVVVDVTSGERRVIQSGLLPPAVDSTGMSPDGRTFYYGAFRAESNIWKLERARPRGRPPV